MTSEKKKLYMKEWRKLNRERLRQYNRDWLQQNKEENAPKAAVRNARWYQKVKAEKAAAFVGPPIEKKIKVVPQPRVLLTPQERHSRKLERTRKWRANNPDLVLEYKRAYASGRPDIVKALNRNFYYRNRERRLAEQSEYRKKNPEKIRQTWRNWSAARPGISAAYGAKYRASRKRATPKWADIEKIKDFYRSAEALRMLTGEWYVVDHKVPLNGTKVSGLHTHDNLQILSAMDNAKKGNKHHE
jgi:hypothetical protein